jgi:hypothetical protein
VIFDVFLAGFTKEMPPVALNESDLSELLDALRAGGNIDVIRRSVELVLHALIQAEATAIGAGPHGRSEARTNRYNGHRPRLLSTKAGDVELAIPKLRRGSFFPSYREPAGQRAKSTALMVGALSGIRSNGLSYSPGKTAGQKPVRGFCGAEIG